VGSRPAFVADLCYETSELVACRSTVGIGGKFAFFAGDGQLLPNPVKEELPTNRSETGLRSKVNSVSLPRDEGQVKIEQEISPAPSIEVC
jgi:hypothetical protein